MKKPLIIAGLFLISFFSTNQAFSASHKPGQILIVFKPKITINKINKTVTSVNGRSLKAFMAGDSMVRLLKVKEGGEQEAINKLYSNPNVKAADFNSRAEGGWVPNDPYYASGSLSGLQWNFNRINIASAWDVTKGSGTTVAVVDTGLAKGLSDINYSNVKQGYDFVNNDKFPTDDNGHGSHVTGTIASITNNSIGTAGVAPDVKILPVKVLDSSNKGYVSTMMQGVSWAYKRANIINFSIYFDSSNKAAKAVFDKVVNEGVPVIACAGNNYANSITYPARYPSLIAVGATGYINTKAPYSNYGPGLDISAPGGDLTVDLNGDGYADGILQETLAGTGTLVAGKFQMYEGTSMATPHVTGVAALLYAQGVRGAGYIRQAITKTAQDLGSPGYDIAYGFGLLNATAALNFPKSTLSIRTSKNKIKKGKSFLVKGNLLPAYSASIRIQTYDSKKGRWSTIKAKLSASSGFYAIPIKLSGTSYIRADWAGISSVLGQMSVRKKIVVF